jgi:hypothetical protein
VAATAAYLSVAAILLFWNRRATAVALLLTPTVAAVAFVNPIGRGLPGFYRSETFHWLEPFVARDRGARWLALGTDSRASYLPYLVKAAGGDVLGGIRNNPDMRVFDILDPERKHFDVWNRFAIVSYGWSENDQIGMTLGNAVSYGITLPFHTELLDRLGIRYILAVDMPEEKTEVPGFSIAARRDGVVLLARDAR